IGAAGFSGYVIARGNVDLVATALTRSSTSLSVIAGQPMFGEASAQRVVPGFVTGGPNYRARLSLLNAGTQAINTTIHIVGEKGADLAAPLNLNLVAGQQYRAELGSAFGLDAATLVQGTLVVEGGGAALFGELTEFDAGGSDMFRTSTPLLGGPASRHV